MAATYIIRFGCDNRKSRNSSVSISHASVALLVRLRLVSVAETFCGLEDCLLTTTFQCFSGGLCYMLGVLFQSL